MTKWLLLFAEEDVFDGLFERSSRLEIVDAVCGKLLTALPAL